MLIFFLYITSGRLSLLYVGVRRESMCALLLCYKHNISSDVFFFFKPQNHRANFVIIMICCPFRSEWKVWEKYIIHKLILIKPELDIFLLFLKFRWIFYIAISSQSKQNHLSCRCKLNILTVVATHSHAYYIVMRGFFSCSWLIMRLIYLGS